MQLNIFGATHVNISRVLGLFPIFFGGGTRPFQRDFSPLTFLDMRFHWQHPGTGCLSVAFSGRQVQETYATFGEQLSCHGLFVKDQWVGVIVAAQRFFG